MPKNEAMPKIVWGQKERLNFLLIVLRAFELADAEDVYYYTFRVVMQRLSQIWLLGYEFSMRGLYSSQLSTDLTAIEQSQIIKTWQQTEKGLKRNYLGLWPYGRGCARHFWSQLNPEWQGVIQRIVKEELARAKEGGK